MVEAMLGREDNMKSMEKKRQAARRCSAAFGGTFGISGSDPRAKEIGTVETELMTIDEPGGVRA